jgi:murein L,D-transpeptidase YcbB/YkuD
VQSILINPPWFVPPTILREDVIPAVISNPQYLDLNSMRVMDAVGREIPPASLDWKRYLNERFPFSVVQSPGGANPLGAFKFEMPNEHAIYLHDTPNRNVFERQTRALSSGCVRVEDAQSLAAILLDDAKHWNADALRAAVGSGQTRRLSVKRRVPVLLVYRTAEVDDEGIVYFRPDLYGRDVGVLEALSTRSR